MIKKRVGDKMVDYKEPFSILVTDADGDIILNRKAEDIKIQHPAPMGILDREFDLEAWLKDPYGGPGHRPPWMRVWIKAITKEEEGGE